MKDFSSARSARPRAVSSSGTGPSSVWLSRSARSRARRAIMPSRLSSRMRSAPSSEIRSRTRAGVLRISSLGPPAMAMACRAVRPGRKTTSPGSRTWPATMMGRYSAISMVASGMSGSARRSISPSAISVPSWAGVWPAASTGPRNGTEIVPSALTRYSPVIASHSRMVPSTGCHSSTRRRSRSLSLIV